MKLQKISFNKAAIFGKLSQLDHSNWRISKAAMFGLDARISLAIFGALSVISGAALYSASQNAKTIAYVTQMQELVKAIEQYMLDTGTDLPKDVTYDYVADLRELVISTKSGWKGPYLSMIYNASYDGFESNIED